MKEHHTGIQGLGFRAEGLGDFGAVIREYRKGIFIQRLVRNKGINSLGLHALQMPLSFGYVKGQKEDSITCTRGMVLKMLLPD